MAIGTTNNITVQDGLAHYSVQSIVQDKYGFMWFGTLNGLTRFDGYNLKNYQVNPSDTNSISNNRIQLIYLDTNKNLWISTLDSLICRYNYSDDNFSRFNRSEITKEIIDSTSRIVNRSRQYATGAGKEFFIHENRYLKIRKKRTLKQIDLDELLPERIEKRDFNCVFVDRTNVLWIGTNYYGVLRIDLMANPFKMCHIIGHDGEKQGIYSIFKDGAKLWLGTQEHGLWVYDFSSGGKKHFLASQSTKNHIASNRVRSFYKDFLGRIWIGFNSGVDVFDPKTEILTPISARGNITRYDINHWRNTQIIPNRNFLSITGDKSNTVWLSTDKGIFHVNALTRKMGYIDLSEYTNNTIISRILFDSKDNAWIGTEGGGLIFLKKDSTVDSFKISHHFHFRHENINSLPDDRVYSIVEDSKGHIWVGTENGLCRVNTADGSILIFNESNGLADPGISCLLSDKYGQLWMSHKKGISKLDINSLSIKNYNIPELESGLHFIPRSGYYDEKENQLYFGHTEGYIHFSPIDIQNNPFEAIPLLVNLKIDNQDIGVKQQINRRIILEQPLYSSSDITLTHKERSISIEFTAIHFANPQLNRFEYKLEGFDMDWIPTSAQNRTATYSNLKPGKYLFKARVANADYLWSSNVASLSIMVRSPWWATWQAILIYFVILASLFHLFISVLLARQKARYLLRVEKMRAVQLAEVEKIRTDFFTNISHELRTPLTLILDPINRLRTYDDDPQEKIRRSVIKRNAERLLTLVNELLDVRKAQEYQLLLNLQPFDIIRLIENIKEAFKESATNRSLSIEFNTPHFELQVIADREKMETVLFNLISNAVKNSNEGQSISIDIQIIEGKEEMSNVPMIEIRVQNHGKTIESNELNRIFEPFFQSKTVSTTGIQGTGLGLTLTRQIIELHGGRISAKSANGQTTFTLLIPYRTNSNKQRIYHIEDIELICLDEKRERQTEPDPPAPISEEQVQHILLIEDNGDIRKYIQSELGQRFKIIEADNGNTGVEMAKTNIPDLVITDVMMPGKSGFEVCTEIKNDIRTCHIPVIILTARQSEEAHIEGYETGADSYIIKPFSIKILEKRIENLITNRQRFNNLSCKIEDESQSNRLDTNQNENFFIEELKEKILGSEEVFNVEKLAESLGMSRSQLYRKVKLTTNQSASELILKIRMEHACKLLTDGKYNVSEIAYRLGYTEQANFSRSFFKFFGKYPTHYLPKKT